MWNSVVDVPGQAAESQSFDRPPSDIDFPPAMSGRCDGRMGVVVVVPAFTVSENSDPPQIPRFIPCFVAPVTPKVRGGIDEPCGVIGSGDPHA